jgi:hypothetical protein
MCYKVSDVTPRSRMDTNRELMGYCFPFPRRVVIAIEGVVFHHPTRCRNPQVHLAGHVTQTRVTRRGVEYFLKRR